jgi:hypothetical protein
MDIIVPDMQDILDFYSRVKRRFRTWQIIIHRLINIII